MLRLEVRNAQTPIERKPEWIRTTAKTGPEYTALKSLVKDGGLHTVCQEAGCPNIYECWEDREATFLIGGSQCTRRCDFCQIDTGRPADYDVDEPRRVAESVRTMGLRYATVTSVARADRRRIVLPEGGDDRVLKASATLLKRGVADLTILGEPDAIRSRATELGIDLSGADLVSPFDPELVDRFATEYARLRAHKGVTYEKAADTVTDVSYFGTMMVHLGLADGMVSGAAHTTAHTIRPAFEIIKTKPGVSVVSSVFLMALADRVLVYGDCAVIPDPTSEQLADIAISSAATAAQFGVEPRVAMLSYSTGESGSGADVEKVRAAAQLAHERAPELPLEGPIQYDAAADAAVAKAKLPDSDVAGRATVFVFPDLNTGNNTYKAVQRSAGALAIGPVLQGLNKPINDLSRGALVQDIVNTVAITAIQAQVVVE